MRKHYNINGTIRAFDVQCESITADGYPCYLAIDSVSKDEVWLYRDAVEYCRGRMNHEVIHTFEVSKPQDVLILNPYQYVWGGQVRDKRANSMCARPYFYI